jgi:hypothetical protein
MTNLPRRIAGVVLMGVAVLLYDSASGASMHRLLLPLGMAIAAWLMVQNAAAVLLGATLLTAIHSAPGNADWVIGWAYPLLAVVSGAALVWIGVQRFRGRIESTREARWSHRHSARDSTRSIDPGAKTD